MDGTWGWWLGGLLVSLLASGILKYFNDKKWHSHIASAFSILLGCISLMVLLAAAGLQIFAYLPHVIFICWFLLYLLPIYWFVKYLYGPWNEQTTEMLNWIHQEWRTNPLKGWGGATFAEFANGLGVLIPIGVYVAYRTIDGNYWWAAQIAALVSVMSTACWVQRYVLEGPEKEPTGVKPGIIWEWRLQGHSRSEYINKTGPNFLGSLTAMLSVQAILIPVQANLNGRENQSWGLVYVLWILIFLVWFLTAFLSFLKNPTEWPRWPSNAFIWKNREHLRLFLGFIAFFAAVSLGLTVWWAFASNETWMGILNSVFAIGASVSYIVSIIWNWKANGYEEKENKLNLMLYFKDITLLIGGFVVFTGQWYVAITGGMDDWFANLYVVLLVLMAYAFLTGLLIGAFNWTLKHPYPQALQTQPADQHPARDRIQEMTPLLVNQNSNPRAPQARPANQTQVSDRMQGLIQRFDGNENPRNDRTRR